MTVFNIVFLLFPITPVPGMPRNLQGDALGPNTIQLRWDPPEDSPVIESYELYYNDSHMRHNVRITINPPQTRYLLTNLTADTFYHVRVAAKSKRGEGARTPTVQVKTDEYSKYNNHIL